MATPARDAALAELEQGTGSLPPGAQPSQIPAPVEASAVIAQLRHRVQAWIDADKLLPADGFSLLAALDQVLAGLAGEDTPAVQAGFERFVGHVEAQIAAGALEASDGQSPIETAARLVARLLSAGADAGETHRRIPPGQQTAK